MYTLGNEMTMADISAEDGKWIVGATVAGELVYRIGNCLPELASGPRVG